MTKHFFWSGNHERTWERIVKVVMNSPLIDHLMERLNSGLNTMNHYEQINVKWPTSHLKNALDYFSFQVKPPLLGLKAFPSLTPRVNWLA